MKIHYFITFLGIISIIILQNLYIQELYFSYKNREIDAIEQSLKIAFRQELHERNDNRKFEGRVFTAKSIEDMTSEELDSILRIEPIPTDTIDLDFFASEGIYLTEEEGSLLIDQDRYERKGLPFNLAVLDSIFHVYYPKEFPYSFTLLYYKDKKVIDSTGNLQTASAAYESRLLPIGAKGERRLLVKVDIPFSYFIRHEAGPLVASMIILLFVLLCLIFQVTVIRIKSERLKQWETKAHGTIHDLKAPLNSVVAMLSLFKMQEKDTHRKELLADGILQLKQLAGTIDTLLMMEWKSNRKLVLHKKEIDLKLLAEQIKRELDSLYRDKPHEIRIEDDSDKAIQVDGDPMYIGNVLRNLMENALKYSDNGVKVRVSFHITERREVEVCVEDNGWGIEPKYRRKLFTQFYQVPRPNEQMQKGHGIGLAQSKLIVKAHNGTIGLRDRSENCGILFYFTLPLN